MTVNVLDHVSDVNGAELYRLSQLHDFPDFVKSADVNATRNPGELPESVYAAPSIKAYPCHTPASTYLSALFFQEKSAQYHPRDTDQIRKRLDGMIEYWGIKAAVDKMRDEWNRNSKAAEAELPDSDFAFVWKNDDGTVDRHLRMSNAMETKVASEWLYQHRDELVYADRRTVADKITEKAAQYGASLGEHDTFIERQSGRGVCDLQEVSSMIRNRAKLATDHTHRSQITKLAETVENTPQFAMDPNNLTKLAETVDSIDRALRLVGKYTDALPRPEDVIFRGVFKEAKASINSSCSMTSGTVYNRDDFANLDLQQVKAAFGDAFANEVQSGLGVDPEKCAAIAATLPLPDAEIFDTVAKAAGINPLPVKAASDVDHRHLAAMAESY